MTIDCLTDPPGRLRHVLRIGPHTLVADTPLEAGGDASGPSAHDYFDASLAVCMAQTGILYARLHGIRLDRVSVHVDRDDSREREGRYVLGVVVGFEGDLTAPQRARILEILGRCPVHRLMTDTTIEIRTVGRRDEVEFTPLPD